MDFLDALNRENIAGRWTAEFIGPVAGTHRNGQRINAGGINKIDALRLVSNCSIDSLPSAPMPSSSPAMPVSATPDSQSLLNRHATGMRHLHSQSGNPYVVVKVSRGFAILAE